MKNLAAFTPATHPYPPYVNVSRHVDHNGVRITVRSPANEDGSCGSTSFIDLNSDEYRKILREMMEAEGDCGTSP